MLVTWCFLMTQLPAFVKFMSSATTCHLCLHSQVKHFGSKHNMGQQQTQGTSGTQGTTTKDENDDKNTFM